jgi:hypothetical protein
VLLLDLCSLYSISIVNGAAVKSSPNDMKLRYEIKSNTRNTIATVFRAQPQDFKQMQMQEFQTNANSILAAWCRVTNIVNLNSYLLIIDMTECRSSHKMFLTQNISVLKHFRTT